MTKDKTVTMPLELVSVPRELLERHLLKFSMAGLMFTKVEGLLKSFDDLNALLAAPVVERQEPVLFVAVESIEDLECVGMHATRVLNDLQCVPLYTSPPAPVALVLPERREPTPENPYLTDADHEWNACLDKVKELNQ